MVEVAKYQISVNPFEAGLSAGLDERRKQSLSRVFKQLLDLKEEMEKEAGVVKTLLPNGLLELTDKDGNRIIRPPYSWEVKGN